MSELPVTEMTLYKHGVGFFKREGKVKTDQVSLTFRHDEINDVLKSLVVFEHGEGEVLGIHYQTPLDVTARQADSSIRLSDTASLRDLLRDLRGRRVELTFSGERIRGRLIGIDQPEDEPLENTLVSVVSEGGSEVSVFRLKTLVSLTLLDDRAEHDLHFFLDSSMSEELRRAVTVRLSPGGKHKIVAYYVAPSPTWRVSYRFVGEGDNSGQAGAALLQGWGVFDNRLDEDLEDVSVTLVAGQPISFIYDLYSSRIPERPVVEDEARTVPAPVEFQAERRMKGRPSRAIAMAEAEEMLAPGAMPAALAAAAPALSIRDVVGSTPPAAEGHEVGEFFEYTVTLPVSVKRGESALVPIVGAEVAYQRELLYNGAKLHGHPVVALRFANTTGLTLERGPVTIVEDGDYKGEAIVAFTKPDNEVYLAYAVELGVRVTERTTHQTEMAGLNIRESYLLISEYQVNTTTYILENTTGEDKVITVEAPVTSSFELYDTRPPDVELATERRWRVVVPAHEAAEFVRRERHLTTRHEEIRKLTFRRLQHFLTGRWLDQATFDSLSELLDNIAFVEHAQEEQAALQAERIQIYEREVQLRENLTTLKPAGDEGALRARVLQQLEASENRIEAIEERLAELAAQSAEAEARIEATLAALGEVDGG